MLEQEFFRCEDAPEEVFSGVARRLRFLFPTEANAAFRRGQETRAERSPTSLELDLDLPRTR